MIATMLLSILQQLIDWDTQIFLAVNGWHSPYGDSLAELISGRFVWIPCYVALAVSFFRGYGLRIAVSCLLLSLLLLVVDDQLCSSVVRSYFERLRPSNPENPISPLVHIVDGYRGGRFGFPSAHACNTWGQTFFFIYLFRHRVLSWMMVGWSVAVCYSRMYLGVHYFGDLVAGLALGLFNATWIYLIVRKTMPQMVSQLHSSEHGQRQLYMPVLVFAAELAIMLLLAAVIDPARGI